MAASGTSQSVQNRAAGAVRPPAVAGRFYPADPDRLRRQVERFVADGRRTDVAPQALIAPHAGYAFSGPIAGSAYAHLANMPHPIERIVLIGPAHFVSVDGLALSGAAAFATPLGEVPLDSAGCAAAAGLPGVVVDDAPHRPDHALEVQLPFLQVCCPQTPIVPLLTGAVSAGVVAAVLERLWETNTLVVVSSDLSHFLNSAEAGRADRATAGRITQRTPLNAEQACGHVAINGLLAAVRHRGLTAAAIDVRHSGETAGSPHRVVGYGAFVFSPASEVMA